ncbi:hypothetical protein DSM104299_02297 [Baekduia alba]|uniref:hypothetical protein n=1 Tax=Baekduia alba TaxID=2997333 RepID=UPI00234148B3|nr:hypothetical protein [Baekduia alba]WCB93584.1 hypothetical protein DSM104299_02297 [Baekduia alba]
MPHLRSVLLVAALAVLCSAVPASADTAVGSSAKGTPISADAGWAAWRGDDGRFVLRAGSGAAVATSLRAPASAPFDVGTKRGGGGAQVAWAGNCSTRSHACDVLSAVLRTGGPSTLSVAGHISYRGGGAPALAINGSKAAYTVRDGKCDVPYVRTLPTGTARKLDRGHCADISQLDLTSSYVGVLAHPAVTYGTGATEARVVRVGGGSSRTFQREAQGEESNFIGSIAFDGSYLYTVRGGIRQANAFTRWNLSTRTRSDARAFVNLGGAFSRDRGRSYYTQTENYEGAGDCPCVVVGGDDPFASAARQLIPALSLAVSPQPVYVDSDPSAVATLTRQTVSRTATVGDPAPVAGVTVELLAATATDTSSAVPTPAPTGATGVTGADGLATIRIPGSPVPRRILAAVTRPAGGDVAIPTNATNYVQTYVHVTASATRLADGRLQVTGAITPAQPGRKVRLDRKLDRICNASVSTPGSVPSPNQNGVPPGCFDRYTQDPVATADVSADGSTYTSIAPAATPAGTYSVSLDSPRGPSVYAGQTAGFAAP